MGNNRIAYIDRLKGLAIILVVIGHLLKTGETGMLYRFIYSFHMPLFMFLSGLVIKDFPKWQKLSFKLTNYLLPFFFVGVLYSCFIGNSIGNYFISAKKLGYWYLLVLAEFYMLLFIYGFFGQRNMKKDVIFALLCYLSLFFACKYLPSYIINGFSLNICYQNWPFFVLGFICRGPFIRRYDKYKNVVYTIALLMYVPLFIYWMNTGHAFVLQAYCAIILLFSLFNMRDSNDSNIERKLSIIGRKTLDIYIYHSFFTHIVNLRDLNLYLEQSTNLILEFVVCLSFSLLIILLSIGVGIIIRKSELLSIVIYGLKKSI